MRSQRIVQKPVSHRGKSGGVWDSFQQLQCVDHFDRGECRLGPFVAGFTAGSVEGLVKVFAGEDSEEHRDAGLLGGVHQAGGDLVVDVVVVSRLALDDGSERDDGRELLAAREMLCELR